MTAADERGNIATPGDPAYEYATQVFNLSAPARPAMAITARTVDDVRAAVAHAAAERLPVRTHTTGHASAAVRPMDGALLIRTELTGGVDVDTRRRLCRVPAGTQWGPVVEAAAAHGLAAPHGSAADVGVVGYLLRGGLSFYGRTIGLAANGVRAVELVTGDGDLHRVDDTSDPALLWALRGGGGGFGVVTAVEFELFRASTVITGASYWPARYAERLLSIWRSWTLDAPEEVTTSVRVMNLPRGPEIPEALSSGPVLVIDGAVLCADEDPGAGRQSFAELIEPLRAVAEPVVDTWEETTPLAVVDAHMDPAVPMPFVGDHMLLDELGEDGIATFLSVCGEGSGSPLIASGLRQLGGAFATPDPRGGVLDHLEARYSYAGAGLPMGSLTVDAIKDAHAKVRAALSPWDTGRTAPGFVESFDQPQGHLDAEQITAVDRVRERVDPAGLFRRDIAPGATLTH